MLVRTSGRAWLAVTITAAILVLSFAPAQRPAAGQGAAPSRALAVSDASTPGEPALRIVAPEHFAMTIDGAGIAAWSDLATDPAANLVPAGGHLLAHHDAAGAPFAGKPRLVKLTPLRAIVRLESAATALTYTIWAGGHVVIEPDAGTDLASDLSLAPDAASGATLQPLAGAQGAALLSLGAWTAEGPDPAIVAGAAATEAGSAPGALRFDATGALAATYTSAAPLRLTVPPDLLHRPRFRVAGWPDPEAHITLAGTTLVQGADYLADWDADTGELSFQYLGLLTTGDPTGRTFELDETQAAALSLEILNQSGSAARTLAPDGLLRVDANMPTLATGVSTVLAIFDIPYIQTWPDLRLRATVTSPPAGFGGVRFAVSGPGFTRTVDDTTAADGYGAVIALPRRAEYSVTASALIDGQPAAPSRNIARVAYGRVFLSVGDSITAGKWGFFRSPGQDGFPFTAPPAATYPQSADHRNYPQQDSYNDELTTGTPTQVNSFYAGYQVPLNDALSQCLNSPVFILNEGISGIRTGRDNYVAANPASGGVGTKGKANILAKAATIRNHIGQLGAEQVLLQTGTNDASSVTSSTGNDPVPPSVYNSDLRDVIAALRQGRADLSVWVARIPWRNNGVTADQAAARRAKTVTFNAEIVSIVNDLGATAPVRLGPDFYSYFEQHQTQFNADLLHPNIDGLAGMANLWGQTVCAALTPEPPPPTVTPTPSTTPVTPTPSTTPVTPTPCPTASDQPCPAPDRTRVYLPFIRKAGA